MNHARTIFRSLSGAVALLALGAPTLAEAGATRASEQRMPQARAESGCSGKGDGRNECEAARRDDRGPPAGFPHSPGLEEARHHADCHAAFRHCDSPGG
jgi:hypothetical protein